MIDISGPASLGLPAAKRPGHHHHLFNLIGPAEGTSRPHAGDGRQWQPLPDVHAGQWQHRRWSADRHATEQDQRTHHSAGMQTAQLKIFNMVTKRNHQCCNVGLIMVS